MGFSQKRGAKAVALSVFPSAMVFRGILSIMKTVLTNFKVNRAACS